MKILIVPKPSKYEYERFKFKLSHQQIMKKYSAEHAKFDAILASHEGQLATREKLQKLLPGAKMLPIKTLQDIKKPITGFDVMISLGGDNSFSYISHYTPEKTLFVGINSDPERSVGAMCSWSARDLEAAAEALNNESYHVQEWQRLQASIDNKPLAPATSEYFFGEKFRKDMTRHILVYRGKEYEQKNSGILFATAVGTTGWFDSSCRFLYPQGKRLERTEKKALFICTEPYTYAKKFDNIKDGELLPGEKIVIHSLNDGEGYATADCWEEYRFMRGASATIELSKHPLRVLVP